MQIDAAAIEDLAVRLADHRFEPASYDYEGTPDLTGEEWARFVILGVSVVWRLWPPPGERMWGAVGGGRVIEDASGVWTCFGRDLRSIDLDFVAGGGLDESFFAGVGTLQDIPTRLARLQEVATAILERHGTVTAMIEGTEGEAVPLRDLITATIPGYHDRPMSPVGVLPFDKLANLAVTMLAARLPVHGVDAFPVFPDYMLPRHLRHEGVLVYAPNLAANVDAGELLAPESLPEMAIRWATIRAAEQLRTALHARGNAVTMPELDYWLWSEAVIGPRAHLMGRHHLCVTEAY
ncbi:MAG: queuosine salvage family protein [Acidimicrobiia bacterium]|nr:queuosine salvage family protein [Acidimicrobiia bacterium]